MDFSIPSIFTQTIPEAVIWSQGVFYQSKIADILLSFKILPTIVALYWTIGLIRISWKSFKEHNVDLKHAIMFTIKTWGFAALGIALLSLKSSTPFSPISYNKVEWKTYSKDEYLNNNENPLWIYVILHKGFIEISDVLTNGIVSISGESNYNNNVDSVFQMIADSATQNIDDPNLKNDIDILSSQCRNKGSQKITGVFSSFSSFFDLSDPNCAAQYSKVNSELSTWADSKIRSDANLYYNAQKENPNLASGILIKLGLLDEQKYKNKIIASALVNYAHDRSGFILDVDHDALLGKVTNADTYADISAATDLDYLTSGIAKFFTGKSTDLANVRNNLARQYNSMLAWIPAFRGMSKAFIAVMFLVSMVAFCFGFTKMIFAWFGMTFWFTLYMPLSALAYEITMHIFADSNSIKQISAIGSDPLSLAAASQFDAHASQYMVAYFMAQIAILSFTSIFGLVDLFKGTKDNISSTVIGSAVGALRFVF